MRRILFIVVALFCPTHLPAQAIGPTLAGYQVGARDVDTRSIPCELNDEDFLCQPSSDTWLRFRKGELVEISQSTWELSSDVVTSADLWAKVRPAATQQFGIPDSVRTLNNLPPAYLDGVVAFWMKPGAAWCANMKVKIRVADKSRVTSTQETTIEKKGTWYQNCSAYPELSPNKR
jgi:hypothetical protein